MQLSFRVATDRHAATLAALHTSVAADLTEKYGRGHWSSVATEKGALRSIHTWRVLVASHNRAIVGTLALATKKPWAIKTACFTPVPRPLYLLGMAVAPALQGRGIGRRLLEQAVAHAKAWPSEAIRLDSYDAEAGAGGFYARCGFREVGRVTYRRTPLVYFERLVS